MSIICGYNLKSHPSATISWTDPRGKEVTNSERYTLDDGPNVIQLNISNVTESDNGMWKCLLNKDQEEKTINLSVLGI